MFNSPLYAPGYNSQFSGHETFPLRYGWLKKVYDAISSTAGTTEVSSIFSSDSAIARFGVGKNMVSAMRYWAIQSGMAEGDGRSRSIVPTELGYKLLSSNGLDPYMENPSTLWLIHWKLASNPQLTTWYWVFNHLSSSVFDREQLVAGMESTAKRLGWNMAARATIKRDVECFVRSYVSRPSESTKKTLEDVAESPLTELGLIKSVGKRDGFRILQGAKPTLGTGVLIHSLVEFWRAHSQSSTLSIEALAHQPGSPGRVFQLGPDDLTERLVDADRFTGGALKWSETAGLKQIMRTKPLEGRLGLSIIESDYC